MRLFAEGVEETEGPPALFPISQAALFPFGKEMHSLLRFHDLLSFQIVDVYDVKHTATVGATVRHLMKEQDIPDLVIKNIETIKWDNFDTLILGAPGYLVPIDSTGGFSRPSDQGGAISWKTSGGLR